MKNVLKTYIIAFALAGLVSLCGCWQPIQPPYITRKPPYEAILQFPYENNEVVLSVMVREELGAEYDHTYQFDTRWHIEAIQPIPVKNFKLIIGDLPSGFNQVIPENNKPFTPTVGKRYVLKIETSNHAVEYCTWWMPLE